MFKLFLYSLAFMNARLFLQKRRNGDIENIDYNMDFFCFILTKIFPHIIIII